MLTKSYKASLVGPLDLPIDYYNIIVVIFGIQDLLETVIIFNVQSIANIRNMKNDLKQISMAMMFRITNLMTNYLGFELFLQGYSVSSCNGSNLSKCCQNNNYRDITFS
uniref:Uncharacterized protein n=1 Tax=Solanum lycopersicum TaxID=4081 RepID=A0A3Q7J686_SOLLC